MVHGSNSSISGSGLTTITSAGGGAGGGGDGSSLESWCKWWFWRWFIFQKFSGGSGNTPSTAPSQGNNGGLVKVLVHQLLEVVGVEAGAGAIAPTSGENGGNGTASSITGSSVTYAGGGGGNR
jgi:hypothetical protein